MNTQKAWDSPEGAQVVDSGTALFGPVRQVRVEVDLPRWANGPYRDGAAPYNPDLDDGVKVNLLPVQEAGLLPVRKVV